MSFNLSLRNRLTLLYSTVLGITLLFLAFLLYFFMAGNLIAGVDKEISQQSQEILRSVRVIDHFPFLLEEVVLPDVDVFAAPDTFLQVINTRGKIVSRSQNLGNQTLPFSSETITKGQNGEDFYQTFQYEEIRLRVGNHPLIVNGNYLGVIQVGRSLATVDKALSRLKFLLIIGSILALFVAATSGSYLAKVALRPIAEISNVARKIAETGDLTRRINYKGVKDELAHLADTFDNMVEKLEEAYVKLKKSNSDQKRFVADASHELRTPLTTIRGNIEFLQKVVSDRNASYQEILQEVLADIKSEAERMSTLVQDLLALARADAGFQMQKSPTSLSEVLAKVIRSVEKWNYPQEFQTYGLKTAENIIINANKDYLQEAFFILLDNAFKYTPFTGKVTLYVRKRSTAQIEIAVQDTGRGISAADLNNIFKRFFRADPSRKKGGTGLGLSICKWIVEQHGGKVQAESQIDKGSTFTIILPIESI